MEERLDQSFKERETAIIDVATLSNFKRKAEHLSKLWQIEKRLGIEEPKDTSLITGYLTQRIMRTSIYESSWWLGHPAIFTVLNRPFLRRFVRAMDNFDRIKRHVLTAVDTSLAQFVEEYYPTADGRIRTRTIELAINDLVAQATPQGQEVNAYKFLLSEEQLDEWTQKWRLELRTQNTNEQP